MMKTKSDRPPPRLRGTAPQWHRVRQRGSLQGVTRCPGSPACLPTACRLVLGTAPGAEQVLRAQTAGKPGWKQLGSEVGSSVATGGERAAGTALPYFIILLQVS